MKRIQYDFLFRSQSLDGKVCNSIMRRRHQSNPHTSRWHGDDGAMKRRALNLEYVRWTIAREVESSILYVRAVFKF